MNMKPTLTLLLLTFLLQGCSINSVASIPMRVGSAVVSVIPVVGEAASGAIDVAADIVDINPL